MLARVLAVVCLCVSLFVCVSVTYRYCKLIKTAKGMITQTTSRDSSGTLVFWRQQFLVDDPLLPETRSNFKVTHFSFEHHDFDQYPLIAPQPWELAKKVQLALIRSWQRTFQPEYVTPKSPKG